MRIYCRAHGSQCGFCTPGFVMAMYSLLRNSPHPTQNQIDEAIQGNLCRCTGYRPILEAFYSFAVGPDGDMKIKAESEADACGMGENCCKRKRVENDNNISCFDASNIKNGFLKNGNGISKQNENSESVISKDQEESTKFNESKITSFNDCRKYDPTTELIFPPELKVN